MKSIYRNVFYILTSGLITPAVIADTAGTDIENLCKYHSIQVVKTLKERVITEMNKDDIRAALAIARQSCFEHFGTRPVSETIARTESAPRQQPQQESGDQTTGDDWFSKYVLEGNPHEKAGVKRLKNRKR